MISLLGFFNINQSSLANIKQRHRHRGLGNYDTLHNCHQICAKVQNVRRNRRNKSCITKYSVRSLIALLISCNFADNSDRARTRMVLSYLFAQLLPSVRGRSSANPENPNPGSLLVLGSGKVLSFLFITSQGLRIRNTWSFHTLKDMFRARTTRPL